MKLEDEKYEEIKAEVIELFKQYNIHSIPISGFELAANMGIQLIPYSSLSPKQFKITMKISQDGFYVEPGDGSERIYFNDAANYKRQNMTILHEIGHCVLGHFDGMDSEEAEAEASFFAKYAAAPPPLVHKINPLSPESIEQIFSVSREASIYAYRYYQKWLTKHLHVGTYYTYESVLLQLFQAKNSEVFDMT